MHQIGVMPMPPANRTTCGGILLEREIVARRADLERPADAQVVVDVARAAAARRIALDAERVALRVALRTDQRILPDRSRWADAGRCARRARRPAGFRRPAAPIRRGSCRAPRSGSRSGARRSGRHAPATPVLPLAASAGREASSGTGGGLSIRAFGAGNLLNLMLRRPQGGRLKPEAPAIFAGHASAARHAKRGVPSA